MNNEIIKTVDSMSDADRELDLYIDHLPEKLKAEALLLCTLSVNHDIRKDGICNYLCLIVSSRASKRLKRHVSENPLYVLVTSS